MPSPSSPGDAFTVTAGCDKHLATCKAKFANAVNFRGFPHIPGNDYVIAFASPGDPANDGGKLVVAAAEADKGTAAFACSLVSPVRHPGAARKRSARAEKAGTHAPRRLLLRASVATAPAAKRPRCMGPGLVPRAPFGHSRRRDDVAAHDSEVRIETSARQIQASPRYSSGPLSGESGPPP